MKMQEEPFGSGLCKKAFTMANYLAKYVELHQNIKNSPKKLNYDNKIAKVKPITKQLLQLILKLFMRTTNFFSVQHACAMQNLHKSAIGNVIFLWFMKEKSPVLYTVGL